MRVFLGGTCNGSEWRNEIISMLKTNDIDYFNPVVENWTETCQANEKYERENCDICLYVLTPKLTGFYSIAEVADDSNKRPDKTILVILKNDEEKEFTPHQLKSLTAISDLIKSNGANHFDSLEAVVSYIVEKTFKVV